MEEIFKNICNKYVFELHEWDKTNKQAPMDWWNEFWGDVYEYDRNILKNITITTFLGDKISIISCKFGGRSIIINEKI